MKKILLFLVLAFTFAACEKNDPEIERSETVLLKVHPYKHFRASMWGGDQEMLKVQEIGTSVDEIFYLNVIDGFTFEAGTTYLLRVKKNKYKDPPQDDIDTRYVLVSIVAEKNVEIED